MTDNNIDKKVRHSMLDELLSDEDKAKPPAKKYEPTTDSRGYGNYGRGSYDQSEFDWSRGDRMPSSYFNDYDRDDGPDPMDNGYNGYRRPEYNRAPPVRKTENSVFNRRSEHHHSNVIPDVTGDYPRQIASVLRTCRVYNGNLIMENGERDEVVNLLMKAIGVQLDKAGLCWSTMGVTALRESLKDLLPMAYYGSKAIVMDDDLEGLTPEEQEHQDFMDAYNRDIGITEEGDAFDKATGEVIDEDKEERKAIIDELEIGDDGFKIT